jgi:aspartate aminotransferase
MRTGAADGERLPEAVIATSCSKNLGLYRERVGAASFVSATREASQIASANARTSRAESTRCRPTTAPRSSRRFRTTRSCGALWSQGAREMRGRLNGLRKLLVDELASRKTPMDFSFIAKERGCSRSSGSRRSR